MKLISLNLWGGRAGEEKILDFLKRYQDVDIFCFQEMIDKRGYELLNKVFPGTSFKEIVPELYDHVRALLRDYASYFRPHYEDFYGPALFIKKSLAIEEEGEAFVYKERGYANPDSIGDHSRNLQYVRLGLPKGRTIVNFHGLWNGKGKSDTEDRLLQSDNIVNFLKTVKSSYVLCGDFNLLPDTESLKKFEQHGLRNLIKEFGVTSTRTSYYKKSLRFADYAFVSEGIKVNDFKVLPDEVSDHSPLYLDFE